MAPNDGRRQGEQNQLLELTEVVGPAPYILHIVH
jgi:hypothetical protein